MASMEYDDAAAERLEAVYLGPDVVAQRQWTMAQLAISAGESVIDIGSGPGFLAADLAAATGPDGRVLGVDLSPQMVARATARRTADWLDYQVADATQLPCDDDSFDVMVSTQVAEYVPDVTAFCAEAARVMKPGGRGMIIATDWDAIVWHSEDPDRMARVMQAFAPHCDDPRLPRTLGRQLRAAGLTIARVVYYPIINTTRSAGCYSRMIQPFVAAYIKGQGSLPEAEVDAWMAEQEALDDAGAYFFATGRFCFQVTKPA